MYLQKHGKNSGTGSSVRSPTAAHISWDVVGFFMANWVNLSKIPAFEVDLERGTQTEAKSLGNAFNFLNCYS